MDYLCIDILITIYRNCYALAAISPYHHILELVFLQVLIKIFSEMWITSPRCEGTLNGRDALPVRTVSYLHNNKS